MEKLSGGLKFYKRMKYLSKFPQKKSPWLVFLVIIFFITLYSAFFSISENEEVDKVPISEIQKLFKENKIEKIEIRGYQILAILKNSEKKSAFKLPQETIADLGFSNSEETKIEIISSESTKFWINIAADVLPFLIIIGVIAFLMSRAGKGTANPFSFGQSKDKKFDRRKKRIKFTDVAGLKEAKEELTEIVDFLKFPKKYTKMGAKIPRGALLIGSPGTGKTLLARAVAGEANAPFFSISGSEFVEMFVGVGASRVRDLFGKAKKFSPSIIFIDEIDAVGRQRGGPGFSGGHDEREQTLNQILTEMDGFENETNVIVMAATNRPDVLDKALLRPGRFDRRIVIDRPDLKDREAILKIHAKNKSLSKNVDLKRISKMTAGFSGADLENVLNEAAILAAKKNKKNVSQTDIESSVEKVMMGPERKSRVLNPEEKKITAFHEVGHALVAHVLPETDPVHKITIISRGMSLGSTWMMPEEEKFTTSKSKFLDEICSLLGGFAAEKLIFSQPTTGASSDLQRATKIARKMVTQFGMSDLGPVVFSDQSDSFSGFDFSKSKYVSEDFSKKIDELVFKIIQDCLKKTTDILKKNLKILEKISEVLLKKETILREEFEEFFSEKKEKKSKSK